MFIIFFAISHPFIFIFFFFNDTATTEIYTLSLHDALPISPPPDRNTDAGCNTAPSPCHGAARSEEHTSELQSHSDLVCRLLLEKKKKLINDVSRCYLLKKFFSEHHDLLSWSIISAEK